MLGDIARSQLAEHFAIVSRCVSGEHHVPSERSEPKPNSKGDPAACAENDRGSDLALLGDADDIRTATRRRGDGGAAGSDYRTG